MLRVLALMSALHAAAPAPRAPPPTLDQALAAEQSGDDARATSELDELLRADPTDGLAHVEAGRLALKRDDLDRARLELEIATALIPENPRAQYLFGMLEQERGNTQKALASLERAVALRPAYREARLRLGALYLASGDALHAESHYQLAVQEDPSDLGAQLQLARALEAEQRLPDAERLLVQLHAAQPDAVLLTRALAQFYDRTARPALARPLWDQLNGPPKRRFRPLKPSRR